MRGWRWAGAAAAVLVVAGIAQAEPYPETVVSAFMKTCQDGGTDEAVCKCVLERMESEISLEELAEGANEDAVVAMTKACISGDEPRREEKTERCQDIEEFLLDGDTDEVDLDDDGVDELIAEAPEGLYVFQECEDAGWRVILKVRSSSYKVLKSTHRGFSDIRIKDEDKVKRVFEFDGRRYRAVE